MSQLAFADSNGTRIAYRRRTGRGPAILFLPGYMSDMEGGKATALDAWAAARGQAMLRFDYRGCGASDGDFEAYTLADWLDDTLLAIDRLIEGPVAIVGSSMGGWLMLLAALARPQRIAALVGIAAAPDFTGWGFSEAQKREIARNGRLVEPSPYGDAPSITTRAFWESGERLKLLGRPIGIGCPVRLLHGTADADVPWRISLELLDSLRSADVQATLIKGGDHRLSRPGDIELLAATLERLLESL